MITFKEHTEMGYKARTQQNVLLADATLILEYIQSPGEMLTRNTCIGLNKPYKILDITRDLKSYIAELRHWLLKCKIEHLNIAGNGIYHLPLTQHYYDVNVFRLLYGTDYDGLKLIRSGGQTGVDEAAIFAAHALKIPAEILAPKGWAFRTVEGKDVYNEKLFKERFNYL